MKFRLSFLVCCKTKINYNSQYINLIEKFETYNKKRTIAMTNIMFKAQNMRGTLHNPAISVRNHEAGGRFTSPDPK
jgi:hypothetical protein